MGDRGNIKIGDIYFYTHWGGSEVLKDLKNALIRGKDRWNDEPYLARIIFCEMVQGQEMDNTGFGISTEVLDNEHDIPEVDCENQLIKFNGIEQTFEQFVGEIK